MLVTCLNCKTPFEKNVRKNSSPNHFCNRSCAAAYNNRLHPKRHPEGKCRHCGTRIPAGDRYCSDPCKIAARVARSDSPQTRKEKQVQAVVSHRQQVKLRSVALKGGKCQVCGYSKAISALHFHHLDPSQKEFNLTNSTCRSWAKVEKELEKCVLLCNRCHSEVHEGLTKLDSETCRI